MTKRYDFDLSSDFKSWPFSIQASFLCMSRCVVFFKLFIELLILVSVCRLEFSPKIINAKPSSLPLMSVALTIPIEENNLRSSSFDG